MLFQEKLNGPFAIMLVTMRANDDALDRQMLPDIFFFLYAQFDIGNYFPVSGSRENWMLLDGLKFRFKF